MENFLSLSFFKIFSLKTNKAYFQLESRLCLAGNEKARALLAEHSSMESFRKVVEILKDRYSPYHEGQLSWPEERTGIYFII